MYLDTKPPIRGQCNSKSCVISTRTPSGDSVKCHTTTIPRVAFSADFRLAVGAFRLTRLTVGIAWALVQLDGADTGMLHVVDAGGPGAMASGMRVTAKWRPAAERIGHLKDIECFVPEGGDR